MKSVRCACVLVVIVGCGSATPSPEAPDDTSLAENPEPEGDSTDSDPESDDITTREADGSDADTDDSDTEELDSGPLSTEDLNKVLQAVLDDPALDEHLKADKPGRAPVKISGDDLPSDLKVIKGGYNVKIVDEPKSDKDPVLVITRIDHVGNMVTVAYRYAVEGVKGTSKVKKGSAGWELMSSRIMQ